MTPHFSRGGAPDLLPCRPPARRVTARGGRWAGGRAAAAQRKAGWRRGTWGRAGFLVAAGPFLLCFLVSVTLVRLFDLAGPSEKGVVVYSSAGGRASAGALVTERW